MIVMMLMLLLPILCGVILLAAANRSGESDPSKLRLVRLLAPIMIGLGLLGLLTLLVFSALAG